MDAMDSEEDDEGTLGEHDDEVVSSAVTYTTAHRTHPSLEEQEHKTLTGKPKPRHPALTIERDTDLALDPVPRELWSYSPADKERLSEDIWRVSDNGSFVSRTLRVISRDGHSKNFEELTGLDGLTFGVTDFAGTGAYSFFKDYHRSYPQEMQRYFGENARLLLDKGWIRANNPKKRNAGLIRFRWLREGLAQLLSERRFHGFQLAHFMSGKVRPSYGHFKNQGWTRMFSLAALICVANSLGRSKLATLYLPQALRAASGPTPIARENAAIEQLLRHYTAEEAGTATRALIQRGFGYEKGPLPTDNQVGHRGRRLLALLLKFPYTAADPFTGLGTFVLAADERFANEPATA